jgi:hypothetical protein
MVTSFSWIQSPLNFLQNQIFICHLRFKCLNCEVIKGCITYIMSITCILVMRQHKQRLNKITENYRYCIHFLTNTVLDHLFHSMLRQSLKWAHTSFDQPAEEIYNILFEDHLQVTSKMLDVGISSLP